MMFQQFAFKYRAVHFHIDLKTSEVSARMYKLLVLVGQEVLAPLVFKM